MDEGKHLHESLTISYGLLLLFERFICATIGCTR